MEAMVAELEGGEFWLPAGFFNDDFNTEVEGELLTSCIPRSSQPELVAETESDVEDRDGELIRLLVHTFLYQNCGFSAYSSKVPAMETRMWPVLSREGRKLPTPMPSPPTSPAQMESEWDFLYAAAWEVMRMRQLKQKLNGRRPSSTAEIPLTRFMSIPSLTHQHLQLYQLKRQQLIKQQLASAWNWQSMAWSGRSTTNTAMASPLLSSQLPRTGMKAVQLDVGGNRRPSAGTGVFLPKREDIPNESLKKPASFTVLPARSLQTLELNRANTGFHRPCPEPCTADYELAPTKCHQQRYHKFHMPAPSPPPLAVTSPDVLLPTEWSY